MLPHFCKSYRHQNYSGRFGIGEQLEQLEIRLHAVMVQVFRRWELQLLVDVGEVDLGIVLGALFFDGVAQIVDIPGMVLVLFQVHAPQDHD